MACFAGTLLVGLYNGNGWISILLSAFTVMCVAWLIGTLIGSLMLKTVDQHISDYGERNPIPSEADTKDNTTPAHASAG